MNTDSTTAVKKLRLRLFGRFDFHVGSNLINADYVFPFLVFMSMSLELISRPRYVNISTDFI